MKIFNWFRKGNNDMKWAEVRLNAILPVEPTTEEQPDDLVLVGELWRYAVEESQPLNGFTFFDASNDFYRLVDMRPSGNGFHLTFRNPWGIPSFRTVAATFTLRFTTPARAQ